MEPSERSTLSPASASGRSKRASDRTVFEDGLSGKCLQDVYHNGETCTASLSTQRQSSALLGA